MVVEPTDGLVTDVSKMKTLGLRVWVGGKH